MNSISVKGAAKCSTVVRIAIAADDDSYVYAVARIPAPCGTPRELPALLRSAEFKKALGDKTIKMSLPRVVDGLVSVQLRPEYTAEGFATVIESFLSPPADAPETPAEPAKRNGRKAKAETVPAEQPAEQSAPVA